MENGIDDLTPRPALDGDAEFDVCIIGGGLTGLWTAHYLLETDPKARIAIVEKEIAGFGASGRNGGWASALFPRSAAALERQHGRGAAHAMRRAMIDTVDEVGRASRSLGIDIDYAKGGTVAYVRSAAQEKAARHDIAETRKAGVDTLDWLGPEAVRATDARGATFDPNCARIHPAKLVRGLAASLERRGVTIFEQTTAIDFGARTVTTDRGVIACETVVVALEGYTSTLKRTHRSLMPLYSLMIATEPLSDEAWDEIGLAHGQTFNDFRHLLIYGQRTADNRFAFGGRGARYHWGSTIKPEYDRVQSVFDHLHKTLVELFPVAASAAVTHTWGGPLGVPRDWHATAGYNPKTGVAFAGGYVGDGLSTTNLAGRTLSDLITGQRTELTRLPWVGHVSPRWEPEPLRFLGSNAGLLGANIADIEEKVTKRSSIAARILGPLTGH
ncbi:FAD-dependent oxidoreductase [Naasia lichenicola]|uniref:FAD-dependent oxidoreductase n=1 Tax=Naasia lichenicola TaxID=2565933 RepID=A0A4S4FQB7_9MICO|nr:FAD-dependent oxidoreductase [Naasia lichenicola]